jgi:CDP-glycerol glycerophosphotransferase (TagB/SpsB family)
MVFDYDGYIVWNDQAKEELHHFYPQTRERPVYVVGAPQFDIFHQERFHVSRETFCKGQSLDPNVPIVVYAIGSPNFLQEHHGAVHFARRVADGHLGNVQLLVRPHPIHDNAEMRELFTRLGPRVRLQETPNAGKELNKRTQDEMQIVEWVNTFRHADVVINLSSTVTVDAAIFDKPIVNLDFDPQPGAKDQQLIKEVNHLWKHFKPIAESGGVWLVDNFDEMETAVRTYLETPELHREKRRWIVEHVCGYTDGTCGGRMASAIVDFAESVSKKI